MPVNITLMNLEYLEGARRGSWSADDYKFFKNPKSLEKASRVLNERGLDFDILICPEKIGQSGEADKIAEEIHQPGRTLFTYRTNVTNGYNWLPLTAWVLCHRMGHHFQTNPEAFAEHWEHRHVELVMWQQIVGIWNAAFNEQQSTVSFSQWSPMMGSDQLALFTNFLFTMKSARSLQILNGLDPIGELIAQYLICGKVRFNRFENWNIPTEQVMGGYEPKKPFNFYLGLNEEDSFRNLNVRASYPGLELVGKADQVNQLIANAESAINVSMAETFEIIKGKRLIF